MTERLPAEGQEPGFVQRVRPASPFREQGKWQECEYLGGEAEEDFKGMKNGQTALNLNRVSAQPSLPKLAPRPY